MIVCRSPSSGVHLGWRIAGVANVLSRSWDCFQVYVQNCHLSHFRKMKGAKDSLNRRKKQKRVTSPWVPISTESSPEEGLLIRQLATECGNPRKIMSSSIQSDVRFQVHSVHDQSSLTSDGSDLTQDPETMDISVGPSISSLNPDNGGQSEVSDMKGLQSPSNEAGGSTSQYQCFANDSTTVVASIQEQFKGGSTGSLDSELNSCFMDGVERRSVSIEVDASLVRFVKGKGGATQRRIEEEIGVKIILPSSMEETSIVIQGSSFENVIKAAEKINGAIEQAIRSPLLDYSHFISLPLAIHPELVEKLNDFQNSILGDSISSQDGNMEIDSNADASDDGIDEDSQVKDLGVAVKLEIEDDKEHVKVEIDSRTIKKSYTQSPSVLSGLGIDRSIFIKPETFHLTVLMLKLWNKERIATATEVLQKISPKVLEALDNRPISIRLRGLKCMKGSLAKARVLYAPVDEIGGEGRLMRACQVINEAYVEAGLVLEKDAGQTMKLHATLMNARHRKRKNRSRRYDSFDARSIFKRYESEDWGDYLIQEAHLSQRFAFNENGYYHCCASIPFPVNMKTD
uniref:Activating signal cointegrator 1 complex subunit 1 n=1 Tax=Anthurium amnicola TaxID=1678845 RepID=A0A1D1XDP2_9ARAE